MPSALCTGQLRLLAAAAGARTPGTFAGISTSSELRTRMRFTYQQGHAWMTAVKKHQARAANPWVPREMPTSVAIDSGQGKRKVAFKEAEPELVVPDLTGFYLKPYVDWAAAYKDEAELTSERLFHLTYGANAKELVEAGKVQPHQVESLLAADAAGLATIQDQ